MKKALFTFVALVFAAISVQAADFNILKYGAVRDTSKLSTKAVQRAIDACSAAGGGRVVVPTGGYTIGSIFLKSNVHLYLEHGATLYGSTNLEDYKAVNTDYVSLRTQRQTIQLIFLCILGADNDNRCVGILSNPATHTKPVYAW